MRNDDLIGIAAVAMNAEAAGLHAQIFIALTADAADAAADPRIDEHHLADLSVRHIGSDGQDFAGCFVAERQGQRDAAILQHQALAAAEIVAAFPDMQIGMAYARGLDRDDDFVTGRLRIRQLGALKRAAEIDNLIALQPGVLLDSAAPIPPTPSSNRS